MTLASPSRTMEDDHQISPQQSHIASTTSSTAFPTEREFSEHDSDEINTKNSNQSTLSKTQDKFAHLNDFETKHEYADSGNYPHIHYKTKIHPLRFKFRQFLLPYIRAETPILAKIQKNSRNSFFDYYFSYTANFASHTFYVLMLPLPIWLGYGQVGRDLVFIIGYGIYFTGFLKDFCCLPRPRSPPLHRITLSGYTAKEYGFPSSHSANATAVSLFLLKKLLENYNNFQSSLTPNILLFVLAIYYISLIIGRIYCGMHGFSDIIVGSLIGCLCLVVRTLTQEWYDALILQNSILIPICTTLVNYFLIYIHVSPVDDCPCYDDSVAFIGVIMGLEISHWGYIKTSYSLDHTYGVDPLDIPFSFAHSGILKVLLRIFVGVSLVVTWKEISKPLLFKIFKPFYDLIVTNDKESLTFNRIRSDTLERKEKLTDAKGLIKDIGNPRKRDSVGPMSSIDRTEIEELQKHQNYFAELDKLHETNVIFTCGAFKPRYDIEIIVRLIVYAGIPIVVILGCPPVFKYLGLDFVPTKL